MPKAQPKAGGKKASPKAKSSPKPAKKKSGKGGGVSISMKTYRTLRAAYIERPSIRHAAKVGGVRFETAKKYIIEGRPEKNMPAIVDIAKAEADKDKAELELDLRAFRRQYQAELTEALTGSLIEIRLHNARTKILAEQVAAEYEKPLKDRKIIEPSSFFIHQIKAHEILIKLMERSFGAADETYKVEGDDFVSKMTAKECVEFIRAGEIPEHLR